MFSSGEKKPEDVQNDEIYPKKAEEIEILSLQDHNYCCVMQGDVQVTFTPNIKLEDLEQNQEPISPLKNSRKRGLSIKIGKPSKSKIEKIDDSFQKVTKLQENFEKYLNLESFVDDKIENNSISCILERQNEFFDKRRNLSESRVDLPSERETVIKQEYRSNKTIPTKFNCQKKHSNTHPVKKNVEIAVKPQKKSAYKLTGKHDLELKCTHKLIENHGSVHLFASEDRTELCDTSKKLSDSTESSVVLDFDPKNETVISKNVSEKTESVSLVNVPVEENTPKKVTKKPQKSQQVDVNEPQEYQNSAKTLSKKEKTIEETFLERNLSSRSGLRSKPMQRQIFQVGLFSKKSKESSSSDNAKQSQKTIPLTKCFSRLEKFSAARKVVLHSTTKTEEEIVKHDSNKLDDGEKIDVKALTPIESESVIETGMTRISFGYHSLRQKPPARQIFQSAEKTKVSIENSQSLKTAKIKSVKQKPNLACDDANVTPKLNATRTQYIQENTISPQMGEVVWAKLSRYCHWPAIVIDHTICSKRASTNDSTWVYWFGDKRISNLPRENLVNFVTGFKQYYSGYNSKTFKKSVIEAAEELASRANLDERKDPEKLLYWCLNGFLLKCNNSSFKPNSERPIPENVLVILDKIKRNEIVNCRSSSEVEKTRSVIERINNKELRIEDMCLACTGEVDIVYQNPYFHGGMCRECFHDYRGTINLIGVDGVFSICLICGYGGQIILCDRPGCYRVYCSVCIDTFVRENEHKKIMATEPWLCYLCAEYNEEDFGLIKPKCDWSLNLMTMYSQHTPEPFDLEDFIIKRKIRVLSLFDGIGTGKLALEQIGLVLKNYYASEIDADAINVGKKNFPDIIQLGQVENITEQQIQSLGPFDLVIGGSPCNDLSLVNHARKGLHDPNGTGILFFEYVRILNIVKKMNGSRITFWLFENVASMPKEYRDDISKTFGSKPISLDSTHFSCQNRARLFWGNIPSMSSIVPQFHVDKNYGLQQYLMPNLNRVAQVHKICTVTTKSNSLRQGKHMLFPVYMNGLPDNIWVTELEKIFGFPVHYTDVGNISLGKRHKLLGKSWSVNVIAHILNPLTSLFETRPACQPLEENLNLEETNLAQDLFNNKSLK